MSDWFTNFKDDSFIEIYCDSADISKFSCGRIIAFNQNYFISELVSPYGVYDGIMLKSIDNIVKIARNTKYVQKMKILGQEMIEHRKEYYFNSDDLVNELLLYALHNKKIISVEVNNNGINCAMGYVETVSGKFCTIKQIDEYGEIDGIIQFLTGDITQIICDSQDEQRLKMLYCHINTEDALKER